MAKHLSLKTASFGISLFVLGGSVLATQAAVAQGSRNSSPGQSSGGVQTFISPSSLQQPGAVSQPAFGLPSGSRSSGFQPAAGGAAQGFAGNVSTTPVLAGRTSTSNLPLVSEDYDRVAPASLGFSGGDSVAGSSNARRLPPVSRLNVPGSEFAVQPTAAASASTAGTNASAARSTGSGPISGLTAARTSTGTPSGPPVSTLRVPSPSGIDYNSLPASADAVRTTRQTSTASRTTTPSNNNTSNSGITRPTLRPLTPSTAPSTTATQPTTARSNSPILSINPQPAPSTNTPSSSQTAATEAPKLTSPSLSLNPTGTGDAPQRPTLPTLSLKPADNPAVTGTDTSAPTLSLSTSAPRPTNFAIDDYQGSSSSVPVASFARLTQLANAMKSDSDLNVTLRSYATREGQFSARTLSASRALSVRKYLINLGVAEERISLEARGEADGSTSSNRIEVLVEG